MQKKTVAVVFAAAGAVGVGLLVATRSFDAPGIEKAVMREAREVLGVDVEPSRSRFGLFDGLVLEEVTISSDLAPLLYRARLDAIRLEAAPLSLLKGRLELTRLVLERPRVVIALGGPAAPAEPESQASSVSRESGEPSEAAGTLESGEAKGKAEGEAEASSGPSGLIDFDLVPSELRLEEGTIAVRDQKRGRELLSLDGLRLDLPALAYDRQAITPLHALTSKGSISIASLALGGLRLREVSSDLSTERGRFRFGGLRLRHANAGELEGELDLDFNSIPFRYRMSLAAPSVDLAQLAHMSPSGGLGKGRVRLEANGFGTAPRNLKATGSLELDKGRLPALAWLSRIDPSLPGAQYRATAVSFEVQEGRLWFNGLRLAGPRSSLTITGSIGFDDDIELTVAARLGGNESSYRLRGTLAEPELSRLDRSGESQSVPPGVRRGR